MRKHSTCAALAMCISAAALGQDKEIKALALTLAETLAKAPKKTAAVVDFTDLQGNVTELGRFLAEELSVALVSTDRGIEVIDRTHLRALLQEHKLAATGVIDPATARRLGEIAGVQILITGAITPFGDSVRSSVKALDTATARILSASNIDIPKTKAIEELLSRSVLPASAAQSGGTVSDGQRQRTGRIDAIPPVRVNDFVFRVRGCERSGARIRCLGMVTNTGPNPEGLYFRWSNCYTLDDLGTQRPIGNNFALGNGSGQVMQPDLTVAFSLVMDDVSLNAAKMSIIVAVAPGQFPLPMERVPVAMLKNIPIVESGK